MTATGTLAQEEGGTLQVLLSDPSLGYNAGQPMIELKPENIDIIFGNMYTRELESFSDSIINGTPVRVPADEAIYVEKVLEAIYESSVKEKFIDINQYLSNVLR